MLQPKRTKYRKQFRGRMRGAAVTGSSVNAGEVGPQGHGTRLDNGAAD